MARLFLALAAFGLLGLVVCDDDDHGQYVMSYDTETFNAEITKKPHFVMFFAPWCGHCKRLAPVLDEVAKKYNVDGEKEKVVIAKVDCTDETALCSDQGVTGYPTLKFFHRDPDAGEKYKGGRDFAALDQHVQDSMGGPKPKEEAGSAEGATVNGLVELTADNFDASMARGHHFVKFYAPWCGHCKRLAPIWDDLAKSFQSDSSVSIAKMDCTQHQAACGNQGVKGYPTLMFFTDGKMVEKYQGGRELEALKSWVNKMKGKKDPNVDATEEKIPEKPTETGDGAAALTTSTFDDAIASKGAFIKFYAPWCGHCKRLAPVWDDLAMKFKGNDKVVIAKVDCTEDRDLCQKYEVRGYPTLLWFNQGEMSEKYQSSRDLTELTNFVEDKEGGAGEAKPPTGEAPTGAPSDGEDAGEEGPVVVLDSSTFDQVVAEGATFIKFYAPWCGHCKRLAPTWEELAKKFEGNSKVTIAKVDCTTERELCQKHGVNGFPTLVMFRDGQNIGEHQGGRDLAGLYGYVSEQIPHDEL